MKKLKTILSNYTSRLTMMGGADVETESDKEKERNELQEELLSIKKKNVAFFRITVIMTAIVFAGAIYCVYRFLDNPQKLQLTSAATGITISGLLVFMHKLWKEKVATDIIIVLASTFKPDTVNSISAALLKKYFGTDDIKF